MNKSINGGLFKVCGTNWNDPEVGEIMHKNIILICMVAEYELFFCLI